MNKHTPGPWHVILSDNATPHVTHEHGSDFTDISDVSSRVCVMPAEITYGYNSLANARLIAAAPELLEALEEMLHSFMCTQNPNDYPSDAPCNKARAAITKAKGKTK